MCAERRGNCSSSLCWDVIRIQDASYPESLKQLPGAPAFLFSWGNVDLLQMPAIGICGSRHASERGLKHVRRFCQVAVERGFVVVSGYASGVDTEAHWGALEIGGGTVAVIPTGYEHFSLKKAFRGIPDLGTRFCAVSEFSPGQPWRPFAAMQRNKTIVGLSKGMVIVEAGEKGGTIAAGRECLRQRKPLFVVEYDGDPRPEAMGNRILIKEGAEPVKTLRELKALLERLRSFDSFGATKGEATLPLEVTPPRLL